MHQNTPISFARPERVYSVLQPHSTAGPIYQISSPTRPSFSQGGKPPPTPEKFMPTCCCQAEAFPALFSPSPFFSSLPCRAFDRSPPPPPPPLPRYSSCLANFALFSPSYPARTQTAGKWYGIQQRCLQAFDILNVFARATNLKSHVPTTFRRQSGASASPQAPLSPVCPSNSRGKVGREVCGLMGGSFPPYVWATYVEEEEMSSGSRLRYHPLSSLQTSLPLFIPLPCSSKAHELQSPLFPSSVR